MNGSRSDVKNAKFLVTHISLQLISRLTVMPLLVIRVKVMPYLPQTQMIRMLTVMHFLVIKVKVMPLPLLPQTHMRCSLKTQIPQLRQI